jgi:iron complex outermembrane receptor protein
VPVADNNNDLFITPRKRELKYLYLQDEWRINGDWALTTGIRYDDYSDFGNTTNPRLALVWQTTDTITTKLLYGQAFRAPAFTELYSVGNPVVTGSPDLLPEKISTTEAAMSWRAKDTLSLSANIFQYKMTDIIRYETNSDPATGATADNIGEQTGKGIEVEFAWDALDNLRIQGNYAHQQSIDKLSGKDAGLAPENVLHLRGDWRLSQRWASNLQINHVADRQREPSDTRDTIDDYTTVNLSLRAINTNKNWEVTLSLLNIFDADVREPSSSTNGTIFIPMDLPMAGRAAFLRFIYQF